MGFRDVGVWGEWVRVFNGIGFFRSRVFEVFYFRFFFTIGMYGFGEGRDLMGILGI